jgi:hypothetical protein
MLNRSALCNYQLSPCIITQIKASINSSCSSRSQFQHGGLFQFVASYFETMLVRRRVDSILERHALDEFRLAPIARMPNRSRVDA